MNKDVRFGTSPVEEDYEKIMVCRDIVKTILDYGVSQKQILMIIQFLGYELENPEHMTEVVAMTKEFLNNGNGLLLEREGNSNG